MASRPARQRSLLLLCALLAGALSARAANLEVEQVDIQARLDPRFQALYATVRLVVRNRSLQPLEVLEFGLAETLGARVLYNGAWDREGELDWRAHYEDEAKPPLLRVALRRPLRPGKKVTLGVRYEIGFQTAAATAPASVSPDGARLAAIGWYPLPAGAEPAGPRLLRLAARLPKEWQVSAPVALRKTHDGTALATYELTLKSVVPGETLLQAKRRER